MSKNCEQTVLQTIALKPCDDYVETPITVIAAPSGRKLSVSLNLSALCTTRDINVGIFITEILANGREVPFAHKVIRCRSTLKNGACINDKDCHCVEFFIDDNPSCPTTRKFKVNVQAHYLHATPASKPHPCHYLSN